MGFSQDREQYHGQLWDCWVCPTLPWRLKLSWSFCVFFWISLVDTDTCNFLRLKDWSFVTLWCTTQFLPNKIASTYERCVQRNVPAFCIYITILALACFFIDFPCSTAHKPKVVKCRSTRLGGRGKQFSGQHALFKVSVPGDSWWPFWDG